MNLILAFDFSTLSLSILISSLVFLLCKIVYNVYFHPLRHIPGPKLYATSRVPYITNVLMGRLAVRFHELHEQYGPVVRTASNEVSFISSDAWDTIYSRKNSSHQEFAKNYDKWNETANDFSHTLFLASKSDHPRMRKILSHAFSDKMLRDHVPILQAAIGKFLDGIKAASSDANGKPYESPVDFNLWFNLLAFDAVSDFVLGESFHTLTNTRHRAWLNNLSKTWFFISIVSSFKSLIKVKDAMSLLLPRKLLQAYVDQLKLVRKTAREKLDVLPPRPTLMSVARTAPKARPEDRTKHLYLSDHELLANAELIVTAGTDTSATALPATLYLLARNPSAMKKVTNEIRAFHSEDDIDFLALNKMPYLTACLTESLRLYSPVPEGLPRVVPDAGENICGHWIPGGVCSLNLRLQHETDRIQTFCQISPFAANRSSAHFTSPDSFIPERWLHDDSDPSTSKYTNDKTHAFRPFSTGPRDCIGQNFAMTSIRLVLSRLLYRFDVECATEDDWLDQPAYLLWQRRTLAMRLLPASARTST
ncbi:hypothetical protein FH972_022294 [Carpinus fangiana]|uniref:Uncharacterized protein n=1 Tax=Carpinus fangiana TaxID=176857 RepID=A0A5N6KU20_9ROSI|nr:hypothetical protein FH972_022294 [Carpinus fangiana]